MTPIRRFAVGVTGSLALVLGAYFAASALGVGLSLARPYALLALALVPLLVARSLRAGSARKVSRTSLALRALSVTALSLALAEPRLWLPTRRLSTVVLVDLSGAPSDDQLRAWQRYLERVREASAGQPLEIVSYGRSTRRLDSRRRPLALSPPADVGGSDLEHALRLALGLFEEQAIPQLLLLTGGRETRGAARAVVDELRARGVRVFFAPLEPSTPALAVLELSARPRVQLGEPLALQARVRSSQATRATVTLKVDGERVGEEPERQIALAPGDTTLSFRVVARSAGLRTYSVELASAADRVELDNRAERAVIVSGRPRLLYVEGAVGQADALRERLERAGFEVVAIPAVALPSDASGLANFALCVLSDLSPEQLSQPVLEALGAYVRRGGALLTALGPRSSALGEPRPGSPGRESLESLLPLLPEGYLRYDQPSLALVLAIDKSGSMRGEKLERAKEAAIATSALLPPDSYLGVIAFEATPTWVAPLRSVAPISTLSRALHAVSAGGGTALSPALEAAYAELSAVRARVKHVVALTDGQTDEASLGPLVRAMRADGITVSAIGLGTDVNRGLLSSLAESAGGRAYYTRDPASVPRLFSDEARLVAVAPPRERGTRARISSPADFLRGIPIEDAPPLRGHLRARASERAQVVLTLEGETPLLARMRVGAGWSLALATDLKPRWLADWYDWPSFSPLLAQLIREHQPPDVEGALALELRREQEQLRVSVEELAPSARLPSGLDGQLTVTPPRGAPFTLPLRESFRSRYETQVQMPEVGRYLLEAQIKLPDGSLARGSERFVLPYPHALVPALDQQAALARLRDTLGGSTVAAPEPIFQPPVGSGAARPARAIDGFPLLIGLALLAFVGDIAVRRAALPSRRTTT